MMVFYVIMIIKVVSFFFFKKIRLFHVKQFLKGAIYCDNYVVLVWKELTKRCGIDDYTSNGAVLHRFTVAVKQTVLQYQKRCEREADFLTV